MSRPILYVVATAACHAVMTIFMTLVAVVGGAGVRVSLALVATGVAVDLARTRLAPDLYLSPAQLRDILSRHRAQGASKTLPAELRPHGLSKWLFGLASVYWLGLLLAMQLSAADVVTAYLRHLPPLGWTAEFLPIIRTLRADTIAQSRPVASHMLLEHLYATAFLALAVLMVLATTRDYAGRLDDDRFAAVMAGRFVWTRPGLKPTRRTTWLAIATFVALFISGYLNAQFSDNSLHVAYFSRPKRSGNPLALLFCVVFLPMLSIIAWILYDMLVLLRLWATRSTQDGP